MPQRDRLNSAPLAHSRPNCGMANAAKVRGAAGGASARPARLVVMFIAPPSTGAAPTRTGRRALYRAGNPARDARRRLPAMAMTFDAAPSAVHRGEDDLPWVDDGRGTETKVLVAKVREGLWIVRTRFEPGMVVQTHKHTGSVFAFTLAGSWKYREYPEVNRAGSYLFEPAGSIHTLTVPEDNTEMTDVFFAIYGANLNLDAEGNVELVIDAGFIRDVYYGLCEAQGFDRPDVIGGDGSASRS